jgi:tight adherence protein C
MNDIRNQVLLLLAISPTLLFGLWLIASESFTSLTTSRILKTRNLGRRRGIYNHPALDSFILFTILILGTGLVLLTLWNAGASYILLLTIISAILILLFGRAERKKSARALVKIDQELPQFVQLICLLISSGVTPLKSLDLLSRRSNSILANEFRAVVADIERGSSVPEALDGLLVRAGRPGIRRFVTNLLVALERGAPLVPVMVALVRDFHNESKTNLMREAGRSEIGLMLPVVFLLLPISVLFALFPSMLQLQFFFG